MPAVNTMTDSLYDLPIQTISGESTSLAPYLGKVLLIVNVASKCGLTPQYDGLEKLYGKYKDAGLVVLGFPANDFAGQEPGSNDEIQTFCRSSYGVDFPMFAKLSVTGADRNPLYNHLVAAQPKATTASSKEGSPTFREQITGFLAGIGLAPTEPPEVLWNFEKFLVDRQGSVIARFSPEILPEDPIIVSAIESALNS